MGGSGIPKIFSGWQSQHWHQPLLREKDLPEQTLLELHMLDLLPESVLNTLRGLFGTNFNRLDALGRSILSTAMIEGIVSHSRITEICTEHPHDVSLMLAKLEREGILQSQGRSRGKVYYLSGSAPVSPEQVFVSVTSSGSNDPSSGSNNPSSGSNETAKDLPATTGTESLHRNEQGCLISPLLGAPIIDSLAALSPSLRDELLLCATLPRSKTRLDRESMATAILAICEGRYDPW